MDCGDVIGEVEKGGYGSLVGNGECKVSVGVESDQFVLIIENVTLQ